ncbi:MAG TPA: hypothetical protein PK718_04620 [Candidatus Methanofastidiosa archaeon]|nr:hypothetical protein [Candidatus Methanofastidiosa archaeon]HPR41814.1 hypothetical protein [Candidatus Methanofastidiosa archaeon]
MSTSPPESTDIEVGDFALYEFPDFSMYMDDVWYYHCKDGYIRWDCLDVDGDMVEVTITFEFSTYETIYNSFTGEYQRTAVPFPGREYVEMAQAGDYSFIENTHILDEVTPDRVEILTTYNTVNFWGSVHVKETRTYLVDTRTQVMYDAEGNEAGIWTWWIDPADYPLTGQTEFLFSKDFGGGEFVTIVERIENLFVLDLDAIGIEQVYTLHLNPDDELLYLDMESSEYPVFISYIYDFDTGLMLFDMNFDLYDDASRALMGPNACFLGILHEKGMPLYRSFVTEYQFKGEHDIPNYYERLAAVYVDPTPDE